MLKSASSVKHILGPSKQKATYKAVAKKGVYDYALATQKQKAGLG